MKRIREVRQSPIKQGENEEISYKFNWELVGIPSKPVVKLYDITNQKYTDVTSKKTTGLAYIEDEKFVITPVIKLLEAKKEYRLECKVFINQNWLESYCIILGEL